MAKVLGAVPNFSEGRDSGRVDGLRDALSGPGTEVLDASSDPDHHRSVVTVIGDRSAVEAACIRAARTARDMIDLKVHEGVHPRVGALDVLPLVPLEGLDMRDAVASAHRVGVAIAELGVPVTYYAQASRPPGRALHAVRRGGFEAIRDGFPADRKPDVPARPPTPADRPHPCAGMTCVGARPVLLAWNVYLEGLDVAAARGIASRVRENGGGFPGVRALGLGLESNGRVQVSMNLEDAERRSPEAIHAEIERQAVALGGRTGEVEVIGMIPDSLARSSIVSRLDGHGLGADLGRVLSERVRRHVRVRSGRRIEEVD